MTLYISDLDGTLLSSSKKLRPRAAAMLNDLIAGGAAFTYCTARRIQSAGPLTEELRLNIPVILMNGVFIYDTQKNEYLQKNMFGAKQNELLRETVIRLGEQPMVYSFVDGQLRNNFFRDAAGLKNYLKDHKNDDTLHPVGSYEEMFGGEAFYAVFINPKNKSELDAVFTEENGFSHVYYSDVYYPDEYWYEVFSVTASKANAVLQLKEMVGADEIVSFGDNGNDLSMFAVSDRCYAVENAIDDVKRAAAGVIPSNDSFGVPRFMESELFERFGYTRPDSAIDDERFRKAVSGALSRERTTIGTLGEKTVHNALKRYYCDENSHEPRIGSFYADGAGENGLYEIQTGSFSKLNAKLSVMLRACHVTVVYPFAKVVHNYSINEQTGEVLSVTTRNNNDLSRFFLELYRIKAFLTNPNLTICLAMLEIDQKTYYKDASKRRRKRLRREKTPVRYIKEIRLDDQTDHLVFLPDGLPELFTKKEAGALCRPTDASLLLEILEFTGTVERAGKRGGELLYRISSRSFPQ